jgi:hypothetical protein
MKRFTAVLIIPVDDFDNGRKMAERVGGSTIKVKFGSGCEFGSCSKVHDKIAKELKLDDVEKGLISVQPIDDFMGLCNNQEFDIEGSWVGYINVEVQTDKK